MTNPRHVELAALLNRPPHVALPATVPNETADRLFALAVAGASLSDLAAAAADATYSDGYARDRPLATFDFRELTHLVRVGRETLFQLDRTIAPLAARQCRLVRLLDPPAPSDDERTSPPAPDDDDDTDDDTPSAGAIPASTDTAPIAKRPTTKTTRRIE